eukprot:COSAG01_NODE_10411_length_2173_cov_1.449373_2_plen_101_part_00
MYLQYRKSSLRLLLSPSLPLSPPPFLSSQAAQQPLPDLLQLHVMRVGRQRPPGSLARPQRAADGTGPLSAPGGKVPQHRQPMHLHLHLGQVLSTVMSHEP